MKYTKIKDNIYDIADENVFSTLIKGSDMSLIIDTGYGNNDLKNCISSISNKPYMVVNSHGHPDHTGGNNQFDKIYALKEECDVIEHFNEGDKLYNIEYIHIGDVIDLGDIHVEIVDLKGHTKGSIGFLLKEDRILIAGDAFNETLWLFNYGSMMMKDVYETIKRTYQLDFDYYLCGHSDVLCPKDKLLSHLENIENLKTDESTIAIRMGFETYSLEYEGVHGKSVIIYTKDKL